MRRGTGGAPGAGIGRGPYAPSGGGLRGGLPRPILASRKEVAMRRLLGLFADFDGDGVRALLVGAVRKKWQELNAKLPPDHEEHGWVWLFLRKDEARR